VKELSKETVEEEIKLMEGVDKPWVKSLEIVGLKSLQAWDNFLMGVSKPMKYLYIKDIDCLGTEFDVLDGLVFDDWMGDFLNMISVTVSSLAIGQGELNDDTIGIGSNMKKLENTNQVFLHLIKSINFKTQIKLDIADISILNGQQDSADHDFGSISLSITFKNAEFQIKLGDNYCLMRAEKLMIQVSDKTIKQFKYKDGLGEESKIENTTSNDLSFTNLFYCELENSKFVKSVFKSKLVATSEKLVISDKYISEVKVYLGKPFVRKIMNAENNDDIQDLYQAYPSIYSLMLAKEDKVNFEISLNMLNDDPNLPIKIGKFLPKAYIGKLDWEFWDLNLINYFGEKRIKILDFEIEK